MRHLPQMIRVDFFPKWGSSLQINNNITPEELHQNNANIIVGEDEEDIPKILIYHHFYNFTNHDPPINSPIHTIPC